MLLLNIYETKFLLHYISIPPHICCFRVIVYAYHFMEKGLY